MYIEEGYHDIKDIESTGDPVNIIIKSASERSVKAMLDADEHSPDGRSQFVWIMLPNGDKLLGMYPQGDTYFDLEDDHGQL